MKMKNNTLSHAMDNLEMLNQTTMHVCGLGMKPKHSEETPQAHREHTNPAQMR